MHHFYTDDLKANFVSCVHYQLATFVCYRQLIDLSVHKLVMVLTQIDAIPLVSSRQYCDGFYGHSLKTARMANH